MWDSPNFIDHPAVITICMGAVLPSPHFKW